MICVYCAEPLTVAEVARATLSSLPDGEVGWTHQACAVRQVVGSVAHQQRRCTCDGGPAHEDEGLTKRQAAEAALAYWRAMHRRRPRKDP